MMLAALLWGCGETTWVSSVPTYPVGMELNILGEYPHFVPAGAVQALRFTQPRYPNEAVGYAGLLVFTAFDMHYYACDLCCPHCLDRSHPLETDGIFAHCPVCGEDYDLSQGYATPTRGISKEALRHYNAFYNSASGKLRITQR